MSKTVEQMARELAEKKPCLLYSFGVTISGSLLCAPDPYALEGCTECWLTNLTPAEITAKYETLMTEKEQNRKDS